MNILQAGPEHLSLLSPLFDAYRQFYRQPSDLPGAEAFLRERMAREESVIFLAMNGGMALGFTQLYPVFTSVGMKRSWLLNDLFVAPEARGGGVATRLLGRAKEWGRATGSAWLLLSTAADNFTAQSVYERDGWQRVSDRYYEFLL